MAKKKTTTKKAFSIPDMIPIEWLTNHPDNPRSITDENFEQLQNDIAQFPEFLEVRKMLFDGDSGDPSNPVESPFLALAGNQRLKSLKAMGHKKIPKTWVQFLYKKDGYTEAKKEMIMVKDNASRGDWDWMKIVAIDRWSIPKMEKLGITAPTMNKPKTGINTKWVPSCLYESNNDYDIPTLKKNMMATALLTPCKPYGSVKRGTTGIGSYQFYVDDYRFNSVWDDPDKLISSGVKVIVEPNCSTSDEHPMTYGTFLIFKKRWLARYLQDFGVKTIVDLHVAEKFYKMNLEGVPSGWNAFATRGYADEVSHIKREYDMAKKISKKKSPFFVIFGGGQKVKDLAKKLNVVFVAQHMRQRGV